MTDRVLSGVRSEDTARIQEIRQRVDAATRTDGRTRRVRYEHGGGRMYQDEASGTRDLLVDCYGEGDREFYFAAHDDAAYMLDALSEAQQEIARLREARDGWHQKFLAMVEQFLEASEAHGWQPIATAPTNGTNFLAESGGVVFYAHWANGLVDSTSWAEGHGYQTRAATRWMPLPAAPPSPEPRTP